MTNIPRGDDLSELRRLLRGVMRGTWSRRRPSIRAQSGECNSLCDEFLDLCTIHGEYDPGDDFEARYDDPALGFAWPISEEISIVILRVTSRSAWT